MRNKEQVSVRLDAKVLKLLDDLQPHFGSTRGEVARQLLVEALEQKHGLEGLRKKGVIR